MLKAQYNNGLRFVFVSLLLVMLAMSAVGATASLITANDQPHSTVFQIERPQVNPAAVIADCSNGGGSQSGCGG
ncbi:MAG: hypothetical protein KJ069_27410 [Anaerolineae bacterium]|nr:hypothetical protein [Anaerolineae bacterium]